MQDHLELYHSLGFPLVFLRPKSKTPIQKNWSKQGFSADQLKNYEADMNVGIKLGFKVESGNFLGAIDVDISDDTKANEAWDLLRIVAPNFENWPKVTSGRGNGSGHFYFLSKHPVTSRTLGSGKDGDKKTWEVSLMGIGRQCVAPPSVHPNGKIYTWERDLMFLSVESLRSAVAHDELVHLPISQDAKTKIRLAKVKDRSAAIFQCTLLMLKAKVPEDKIIEILTNRKFLLAHVPYEHTGSPEIDKATAWFVKYVLEPAKERIATLELTVDKNGNIQNNYVNAKILTCQELFKGEPFLKHNVFRNAFEWCQTPPWAEKASERSAGREDALLLGDYLLETHGVRFHVNTLDELLSTEAMKNQYHPVRDYLDSLHWDGIPRVSGMFQTYHRSQMAASYLEEVATLWMVGAVARIYEPGTKFDYVIVLEGEQGLGKSTFLETLASKPWFLDSLPNLQDKDASTNIQGAWICEIAELAAMNRSTIEAVKAYLSRNVDRVRPPYGQRRIDIPRSTVFAGTTNPKHYLHDPTGSRRFWPVKVGRCDFQSLIRDRDQLWAEAAFMFHFNRPKLYPSYALEAALEGIHSERRVDDEGDEARALITAWIAVHDQVPTLTLAEYFTHGPLITMKRTRMVDLRVTAVLEDLGFVAQKVNNLKYWYYRGNP